VKSVIRAGAASADANLSSFRLALLLGGAMLLAPQAQAADAAGTEGGAPLVVADAGAPPEGIETVVVTGRHRAENNQDVPIPISLIAGDKLKLEHADRIADYADKVPNFSAVQQNTRVSQFSIRGLGGNANFDGVESGVGLIVDNVVFTHVGFSWFDFVDLDHVEVLRGPQGTLLGKNTTIGAVVITTQEPSFTPEANVELTYGNHDREQIRANVTAPLIDDELAFRLTVSGDKGNGWIRNNFNDDHLLSTDRWSVRGQILFTPTSDFRDRLIIEHNQTDELNNYTPPVADPNYANGAPRAGWSAILKGIFGYTPSFDLTHGANMDTQGITHSSVNGISNQADWTVADHTITSITAFRSLRFRPYNDSDYSPFPILRGGYDVDVSQYSQELRIASPTGQTFEYQGGLYALHERVLSNDRDIFFSDASEALLGSPTAPSAILNGVEYDQSGRATTDSYAGFAQGTWHITDAAALTGGLRYTWEHKAGADDATSFGGAALPPALAPYRTAVLASFGGPFVVADKKDFGSVSWLVNPSYKIDDNIFAYFSASHGEKSGAVNTTAAPGIPVIIKPERATDYEAGVKTTWLDGRLIANLNLYWNDISDYQASAAVTTGPTTRIYLTNAARVRQRGIELETTYAPLDNLTISLSGAYNNAAYVSYADAPAPIELTNVTKSVDLSGRQLPGAPLWNAQLNINYEVPLDDGFTGFTYLNQTFHSKVSVYNSYSSYGWQDAYGLTNFGIGVRTTDGKYSLLLWSKNLADQRYLIGVGAASAITPAVGVLGDPRTFGVTFDIHVE
ncbi:MAG: TonB-dependent receptor, partial [Rhizomicrobium sp.]